MKRLVLSSAVALVFGSSALATTFTVTFDDEGGESVTWVFDDSTMTAPSADIESVAYTWDEESLTVCGEMPEEGEVCATFEALMEEAGATTGYTDTNGGKGTATLVSVEEAAGEE